MLERFMANNYFQKWFTMEFVQANSVNLEEYKAMPLYGLQTALFEISAKWVSC